MSISYKSFTNRVFYRSFMYLSSIGPLTVQAFSDEPGRSSERLDDLVETSGLHTNSASKACIFYTSYSVCCVPSYVRYLCQRLLYIRKTLPR